MIKRDRGLIGANEKLEIVDNISTLEIIGTRTCIS